MRVPVAQRDYAKEHRALVKKHGHQGLLAKRRKHRQARAKLGLKAGDKRQADHIRPLRHGGGNGRSNLRIVSAKANMSRPRNEKRSR